MFCNRLITMATVKESQYQIYLVFILHMRHVEIFDPNGKSSSKIKKKNGRTKRIPCFKRISFFFSGYYGDGLNAIIIFSGCYLPDRSRRDYQYVMDNLFM